MAEPGSNIYRVQVNAAKRYHKTFVVEGRNVEDAKVKARNLAQRERHADLTMPGWHHDSTDEVEPWRTTLIVDAESYETLYDKAIAGILHRMEKRGMTLKSEAAKSAIQAVADTFEKDVEDVSLLLSQRWSHGKDRHGSGS